MPMTEPSHVHHALSLDSLRTALFANDPITPLRDILIVLAAITAVFLVLRYLREVARSIQIVNPDLRLEGLRMIWEHAKPRAD